jgi:hypothetical protein
VANRLSKNKLAYARLAGRRTQSELCPGKDRACIEYSLLISASFVRVLVSEHAALINVELGKYRMCDVRGCHAQA